MPNENRYSPIRPVGRINAPLTTARRVSLVNSGLLVSVGPAFSGSGA